LFIPCGRLSWLPVSFLLHVNYPLSYRMGGGRELRTGEMAESKGIDRLEGGRE